MSFGMEEKKETRRPTDPLQHTRRGDLGGRRWGTLISLVFFCSSPSMKRISPFMFYIFTTLKWDSFHQNKRREKRRCLSQTIEQIPRSCLHVVAMRFFLKKEKKNCPSNIYKREKKSVCCLVRWLRPATGRSSRERWPACWPFLLKVRTKKRKILREEKEVCVSLFISVNLRAPK